jgi:hypothetical protein
MVVGGWRGSIMYNVIAMLFLFFLSCFCLSSAILSCVVVRLHQHARKGCFMVKQQWGDDSNVLAPDEVRSATVVNDGLV